MITPAQRAMRTAMALSGALALATLAGCGGAGDAETTRTDRPEAPALAQPVERPPTAERLVGTWSRIGDKLLVQFDPDGTFAIDTSVLSAPFALGPYVLSGKTITFTSNSRTCADTFTWQVDLLQATDRNDDELNVRVVRGACGAFNGEEWRFARIA